MPVALVAPLAGRPKAAPLVARAGAAEQAQEEAPADEAGSDAALVGRARAGDRKAFELLVVRYRDRIYHLCYAKLGSVEDALDASQEVFLRAYRAIGRFEGKSQFYTWLFRIALNCAFTVRKRRSTGLLHVATSIDRVRGGGEPDDEDRFEPRDPGEGPGSRLLLKEQRALNHAAIRELPPMFQEIVLLRDIDELAYEEIAEVLDLPIGSVKSRLHRARLQLRAKLDRVLAEGEW